MSHCQLVIESLSTMARKTETWNSDFFDKSIDENLKGDTKSELETAILCAGILDIMLGELLSSRLLDLKSEREQLLTRASFDNKIQLALLTGVISTYDAKVFRAFKAIRNEFAHRINISLIESQLIPHIEIIYKAVKIIGPKAITSDLFNEIIPNKSWLDNYATDISSAKGTLTYCVHFYQAFFLDFLPKLSRISNC